MSIIVGLDFGTHQTKICVEDSSDPLNKTHRFFTFTDNGGNDSLFLPSVVQINVDNTVSYGYVDDTKCKTLTNSAPKPLYADYVDDTLIVCNPPTLELPTKPLLPIVPKMPAQEENTKLNGKIDFFEWQQRSKEAKKDNAKLQREYQKALYKYSEDQKTYNKRLQEWEVICDKLRKKHQLDCKQDSIKNEQKYQAQQFRYNLALKKWEDSVYKKLSFRYFKIPTLLGGGIKWEYNISNELISTWYVANIILLLNEKYGEANYSIQIGIPATYNESGKYRKRAYKLLLSAYDLIENKFSNKKNFRSATYEELIDKTDLNISYDGNTILEYGIVAIPEAYASLCAVTKQGKLRTGMHFLVDIGGGTTDIAFFTITEDLSPDIHLIESIPKGLNFILEAYSSRNNISMYKAQKLFISDPQKFSSEIKVYKSALRNHLSYLKSQIEGIFRKQVANTEEDMKKLHDAFKGRQITYCGGGGTYDNLYVDLGAYFNDLKVLNKAMIGSATILNTIDDKLYPILSTAYGLSIELERTIKLTPIRNIFNHIKLHRNNQIAERNDDA